MIQGTGSHVGKSTLVTALCRIFSQDGLRVAPFKAQNMALNSYITIDGCEIGRAQVVQAHAAGIEPQVEMNPVLLKATSDLGAQVILCGKVVGNMKAREYQKFKPRAWKVIHNAYVQLEKSYDLVVIEGAGSPAEVNLKKGDLSNMRVARMANAPVILVGDIDRGGVFASMVGTLELLTPSERDCVAGFVINKFRGDLDLLTDGLKFLERKTHKPVLGVIPYLTDLSLEEEDGVALDRLGTRRPDSSRSDRIKIAVICLPHISNFTDFDPLKKEPGVDLFYVRKKGEMACADVVILPGSKNTIQDLIHIQRVGLDQEILKVYQQGGQVIGICGGIQMLGRAIFDPHGVESHYKKAEGLGLLAVETVLETKKITARVQASLSDVWDVRHLHGPRIEDSEGLASPARARGVGASEDQNFGLPHGPPHIIEGYEIHMGRTRRLGTARSAFTILKRNGRRVRQADGAISPDGRVWGTYLHGLFENDLFRRWFLDRIRIGKGGPDSWGTENTIVYHQEREWAFDRLAQVVRKHLDLKHIYEFLRL
ncbi:MAG: cobyric acid synthase [Nitrospira sp.]|nr:cobyric acid synthase [Nitrospira sp.]